MPTDLLDTLYGPIYGSLYFATIMSTGFYGVTCVQMFFYYVNYQNDPLRIKSFVAAVWVFDTIHEALIISGAYKTFMHGLINPISSPNGTPELVLQLLFTALVAITTQGFFAYRIYVFNGNNIFVPLIWIPMAIYQLVSSLIYIGNSLYSANGVHVIWIFKFSDHFFMSIGTSSLSVAAVVDILIAIYMTFLLLRKRSATEYVNTAHVLQRLTVFAVNAGIWTATFALLSLVLLHRYPSNLLYAVFALPLCSIYCNTLLANLNARSYIRGETTPHQIDADVFASSATRSSDGIKDDKRSRVVSFRSSGNMSEGHGGMPFLPMVVIGRTPEASETACT